MESRFEIIDAFMDGERVDAAALKRALTEEAGRYYLVDAWLLREGVQEDMAHDSVVLPAPAAVRARGVRPWLIAAAILLCLGGGYAVGYRAGNLWAPAGSPASLNKEVLTPQPAPATHKTSFPAPVPTRVIQIDFNATPTAGSGGE